MDENSIVQAIPLREQVADIVRVMIMKGELVSEQAISERYISQMLHISTTPVKEAFRILQSEGLIYSVPRKGSYVSSMSKDNLEQITFIRSSLEGVAAYYAAHNATDTEIARMTDILAEQASILGQPEKIQEFLNGNAEFHQILRNASRNQYLIGLLATMRSIDNSVRTVNLHLPKLDPKVDYAEHQQILEAVRQRNPDLAEQTIIRHIRRVATFVLEK